MEVNILIKVQNYRNSSPVMDKRAQLEELDSLKNIFYSEEFQLLDNPNKMQAIFWAFFTLPDNYTIKYVKDLHSPEPLHLKVKHLPPIELRLTLPKDYPSKNPPEFVICCQWLPKSKISLLCKKLDDLWLEFGPAEIIYVWCDFIKNDSLPFLNFENELDLTELCSKHFAFLQKLQRDEERKRERRISRAKEKKSCAEGDAAELVENGNAEPSPSSTGKNHKEVKNNSRRHPYYRTSYKNKNSSPKKWVNRYDERAVLNLSLKSSPIKIVEKYNSDRKKVEFLRNFYTCNICFSDKLGKDCTQFKDCNHVFCIDCIRSYFTVRIKDGTVQSIKCPEDKCTAEALPSQVKEIVSEELFAKYDSVLLSTALDTLSDIIYCPRQICQYPVTWDPEEKMASCPNCQFVFCVICKMVYHGVQPCQLKVGKMKKVIEEYENGSEEVRQQMETRYGKKYLQKIVNNMKAETWIKENSKECPRCEAAIEKAHGCNKMVCWNCNAPFCWLCCEILDAKDPYLHFNDPKSPCANKLFHLVHNLDEEDDEDDWDWVDQSEDEFSDSDFAIEDDYYDMLEDENLYYI